ncbi:hypothetical protein FRB99_006918 [Tulasnella sp. 403]|nr:hypothetical protein FRB99_006918 [Tulasnella sp. 403]
MTANERDNICEDVCEGDAERPSSDGVSSSSCEVLAENATETSSLAQSDVEALVVGAVEMTSTAIESSNIDKLEEAIVFAGQTAESCADDPILHTVVLDTLGRGHWAMFNETGKLLHIDKAIEAREEAVNGCPPTHPDRPTCLSNLAVVLCARYEISADINDLDRSITLSEQVLELGPLCYRYARLHNLAASLLSRFEATSNLVDLDRSIALLEESLELASPSDRPDRLRSLAGPLVTRFRNTANFSDLERAVMLLEEALILPQSTKVRRNCLVDLSYALWTRYDETRNMADLNRAITLDEDALNLCSPSDIDRSRILNGLATSLWERFRLGKDTADFKRAIDLEEEALALLPPNHPKRPLRISNLAWFYNDLFILTDDPNNLERSITFFEEALHLCPPTCIDRHTWLTNLAGSLLTRFKHKSIIADLDRAIDLAQSAVDSLPLNHPKHSDYIDKLSNAQLRHIRHNNPNHHCDHSALSIDHVVAQLRSAACCPQSPSRDRLMASISWVDACTGFNPDSLFDAYITMFDTLDTVITRGHSLESRYSQLTTDSCITDAKGRICDAVNFAITENRPRDAVVFLERGRALLLAQLGHCRMPLDLVREKNARLAEQLESIGRQLDGLLASDTKPADFTLDSAADDAIAQSMKLTARWNKLVEEVRKLDGCRDFLKRTPFHALQQAAVGGPIIFINITRTSSHAIIVPSSGDPLIVPLPDATPSPVDELTKTLLNARDMQPRTYTLALRDLWDIIVGPVVDRLRQLVPTRSRIWWCPSASIAELPLHAAGHYYKGADPDKRLPQLFVSSYTSSLGALIRARRASPQHSSPMPRLLVISQPNTKGQIKLDIRDEITFISGKLSTTKVLEGRDATPDAVTTAIPHYSWVHFSCHAYSVPDNPLRSHFILHEDHLEVLDILRTQNPRAELAVLTACHTAGTRTDAPEEFLHLAGAMQFTGYRSVIGTLWKMDDGDGTFVVKEIYCRLFEELDKGNRLAYTCAAEALQDTVWKLRIEKKAEPWRWVNYAHYGA